MTGEIEKYTTILTYNNILLMMNLGTTSKAKIMKIVKETLSEYKDKKSW